MHVSSLQRRVHVRGPEINASKHSARCARTNLLRTAKLLSNIRHKNFGSISVVAKRN